MTVRFRFKTTPIDGLVVAERLPISDQRGFLERLFCAEEFSEIGLTQQSGTIRGLHFQYPPHAETKIVTCLKGKVFDVAVDLRSRSSTFLQWHEEVLSSENNKSLYIPPGFAHGFQTLADNCEMLYLHTCSYQPDAEGGVSPLDSRLGISWPVPLSNISERDRGHAPLTAEFKGLSL